MDSNVPPQLPEWAHSEPNEPKPAGTPWGFWLTIAFSICIAIAYIIAQSVGAVAWVLIAGLPFETLTKDVKELTHNGGVIAYATLFGSVVAIGLCVLFARLREEWRLIDREKKVWSAVPYPVTLVTVDAVVRAGGQVLLGEKELYEPRCRRCYFEG